MKNRLAFKILVLLIIPIAVALGFMEYLNLSRDIRDIQNVESEKEAVLVDSIVRSVADKMMEGRPDQARRLLGELSTLEGITTLEVYRGSGTIAFEDLETLEQVLEKKKGEGATSIARTLEKSLEQYPASVPRSDKNLFSEYPSYRDILLGGKEISFMERQGDRTVLTLLKPLRNEVRCQGCHGSGSDIRGIVKISSSQEKNVARIARHKTAMVATIVLTSFFLAVFLYILIRLFVDRPLRSMVTTIQEISNGNLDRQVEVISRDEIGVMAENFNLMTAKLRESQKRLKAWADELENEVRRQTEDLRKANDELKRADQMKSEFLANMSHELRTPLNAVIGFSEVLLDKVFGNLNEKQSKYVDNILTSGKHLLRLINDILDLSKIEAGRMEVHLEEFHLEKVVYEVVSIVKPLATKKNLTLEADLSNAPELICSDEGKLKQVLYNLLSNAVKFTPENGSVKVEASKADSHAIIAVSDTGIGIKQEHLARIFKEFYQVDSSYSRKYEGTGLGLALTRKFVELLGGTISVESHEGAGSRFTIRIPIKAEVCLPSREEIRPLPVLRGRETVLVSHATESDAPLVLVVEDDAKASELIGIYLSQAGYRVVTATNGESAIKMAKELQPFAITLDIMLPKQDGWQVLQEIKSDESTKQIPILVTSMLDDKNLAFTLGATDYFVKPVDKNRLLQRLGTISYTFSAARGPATVLAIDDEIKTLELTRAILEPQGYKVLTASGGAEGIKMAQEHLPHIILLDLMMPEVNGFEVITALKESLRTRNIPIIVLTAKELTREERDALNVEIDNIYMKGDFEKSSLLEEIYRLEKMDPDRAKMVDRLTGMPNYRYLQKRLTEETSRSDRYDRSFCVVMLDIDNFKMYNETNGTILGDAAIKKVAEIMKRSLRRADVATRYVDDKYFLILPETSKESALVATEKIRTAVEQYPFPYQESLPGSSLTISAGIVHYYEDTESKDELIAIAQKATAEAKKNGGNTVVLYKG